MKKNFVEEWGRVGELNFYLRSIFDNCSQRVRFFFLSCSQSNGHCLPTSLLFVLSFAEHKRRKRNKLTFYFWGTSFDRIVGITNAMLMANQKSIYLVPDKMEFWRPYYSFMLGKNNGHKSFNKFHTLLFRVTGTRL